MAVIAAAGIAGADDMFFSRETGIDLKPRSSSTTGMMVIVESSGRLAFEYIAIGRPNAKGSALRVMILLALDHRGRLGPPGQRHDRVNNGLPR